MHAITKYNPENTNEFIVRELRIPRMIAAIVAGGGLSIAGMLMQTLFNNPLAGPYVLGINSGSSLFVALATLSGLTFFTEEMGIISAALLGALCFGTIILGFSFFIQSSVSLLLIGLMVGGFSSSFISVLETYASAEELKSLTLWSMGSLQHLELDELRHLLIVFAIGLIGLSILIKPLNAMILGEKSAENLGVNVFQFRLLCITVTAIFTGLITAYCGPIAFVGLAVPNITKLLFRTQSHATLILANFAIGAVFLLLVDSFIQICEPWIILPLNAVTSIIGAPIIIIIVLKRIK
jgi:iron complex transport system permease protein